VGKRAQIVDSDVDESGFTGAADDAVIERPAEEFGENRDDIEAHGQSV
jgi:hypothetical protein